MDLTVAFTFSGGVPDPFNKGAFIGALKEGLSTGRIDHAAAAREIAEYVHMGQRRANSRLPYMSHVLDVSNGPALYPGYGLTYTPDEFMLALVHDVLETKMNDPEQDWTIQDFQELGYSESFLESLDAISKRDDETYGAYIMRLSHDASARKVKLFDTLLNLNDEPHAAQQARYAVSLPYIFAVESEEIRPGEDLRQYAYKVGRGSFYEQGYGVPIISMAAPHKR